ncbi:MAG TPA: type VII secretion protein EccE, partial [Mycobacterium sp.]|nr:type VII secretion protein EccE [Mycobacterium sp.]
VVSIGDPGTEHLNTADVVITQTSPAEVEVITAAHRHRVAVELFRAENRYLAPQRPTGRAAELQPVD